jgi:hypothetical protein
MATAFSWIGILLLAVLVLVLMYLFNRNPQPWETLAGAPKPMPEAAPAD